MNKVPNSFKPFKHQLKVLKNTARSKCLIWARGGGKSDLAVNIVFGAAFTEIGQYAYLGPESTQIRRNIFDPKVLPLAKQLGGCTVNESQMKVTTANGSIINFLGFENAETIRGMHLKGMIIDEAAALTSDTYLSVLRPTLIVNNGWLLIIGTPKGATFFQELYDNFEGYKEVVDAYGIPEAYSNDKLKAMRLSYEQLGEDLKFRQEYLCEFLSDKDSAECFPYILNVVNSVPQPYDPNKTYVAGLDVAKSYDFMVLSIFEERSNRQVLFDRFQHNNYAKAKERIARLLKEYKAKCLVDSSGPGDSFFDELKNLGANVEPFKYTPESKERLIRKLQSFINQSNLSLIQNEVIVEEFRAFRSKMVGDKVRYFSGKHDDTVNSIALAVQLLDEPRTDGVIAVDPATKEPTFVDYEVLEALSNISNNYE